MKILQHLCSLLDNLLLYPPENHQMAIGIPQIKGQCNSSKSRSESQSKGMGQN